MGRFCYTGGMTKQLVFTLICALSLAAISTAYAQQTKAPDSFTYGGPVDPYGTGNPLADEAAAKSVRGSGTPVFLSGTGPINLRPGAYIPHDPVQDPNANQPPEAVEEKATSAAIFNENRLKQKAALSQDTGSPFPPGW